MKIGEIKHIHLWFLTHSPKSFPPVLCKSVIYFNQLAQKSKSKSNIAWSLYFKYTNLIFLASREVTRLELHIILVALQRRITDDLPFKQNIPLQNIIIESFSHSNLALAIDVK